MIDKFFRGILPILVAVTLILLLVAGDGGPLNLFLDPSKQLNLNSLLISILLIEGGCGYFAISYQLKKLREKVDHSQTNAQHVPKAAIYDMAVDVIATAEEHIRIVLHASRKRIPEKVLTVIAKKLRQGKVIYDLVLVSPDGKLGEYEKIHERLKQKLREHVGHYKLWVLQIPEPDCLMEMVAIDDIYVGLGFQCARDENNDACLLNHSESTRLFVHGFDHQLKGKAKLYEA
ncbi:MAG TPA: hypothetical protein VF528_05555 [Pyrinomonadaceae bacterium]|jgi:hypothetical protein